MNKLLESKKFKVAAALLGLYLIVSGISWAAFTYLGGGSNAGGNVDNSLEGLARERAKIQELPKTEECPINGGMFSTVEREIWEGRRPLTAVVENHSDSRPQSGLGLADVVYEAVAEGGITRFLGVFYCGAASAELKIAPVRSARVYFIKWAAEYGENPLFLHVGGANSICNNCPRGVKPKGDVAPEVNAFALLDDLGWRRGAYGNDFDGGTNVGVPVVIRDQYRTSEEASAWEHSVVASVDEVHIEGEKRGFGAKDENGVSWDKTFKPWKFADDAPLSSPKASKIAFEFWSNKPEYDVTWDYDPPTNSYKRNNGGESYIDWENKEQVLAKNVLIQFLAEKGPVDRELHMYYENIGDGDIILFQNGDVIEGTWEKEDELGRTIYLDPDGEEIKFVRGTTWIEAVPIGNDIVY